MSASTLGGSRAALAIAVRYAYQQHISGPVAGQRAPLAAHRSHPRGSWPARPPRTP
ncbi:hypothetical protein [Streptomyces phaeochromogenes]|uniref:hypothetical protein n=1 Tax=Streptomyces phaeochromogenes TaxID=1923 RepID=UPI0033E8D97F